MFAAPSSDSQVGGTGRTVISMATAVKTGSCLLSNCKMHRGILTRFTHCGDVVVELQQTSEDDIRSVRAVRGRRTS